MELASDHLGQVKNKNQGGMTLKGHSQGSVCRESLAAFWALPSGWICHYVWRPQTFVLWTKVTVGGSGNGKQVTLGMCSSWPGTRPGGPCLLLESLWTWALESLRTRVLPISLGKLRPKVLSNAEFSAAKLERRLFNSADGVIVWDVESDLQLFLFICGCGPF